MWRKGRDSSLIVWGCRAGRICLSILVHRTAVTEYHRPGGLDNKHLFLIILEAGKSKIMVLKDLVVGEGLSSDLWMTTFPLSLSHGGEKESELVISWVSSNKSTNPTMEAPPSWPNLPPKSLISKYHGIGARIWTEEFGVVSEEDQTLSPWQFPLRC